jgi:uncharacterized Fe-S cluster-containing radical SAM superfamily protein
MMDNNESICAAPWVHLFGFGDDKIFPCCKSKDPVGSIKDMSLKEIWNSKELKDIRVKMLKGEKISSCETCYLNEKRWGDSYRKVLNRRYPDVYNEIVQTKNDGSLDNFNLKYLDLRFSNLCNFKCVMCGGFYSTAWYQDENTLKRNTEYFSLSGKRENNYFKYLRSEIPEIIKSLNRINFAGGEPFLIKEYLFVLDELLKIDKVDTEITFNTNLSIIPDNFLSRLKNFKKITFRASIDGYGDKGEFIRKGLNWKMFLSNVALINRELPQADIRYYCTVQILNVFHILDLYKFLIKSKLIPISPNKFHISFVETPSYYDIRSLDKNTKHRIVEYYNTSLSKFNDDMKKYFYRIIIFMNEKNLNFFKEFKDITNKLDKARKQNTRLIFPELSSFFDYINL